MSAEFKIARLRFTWAGAWAPTTFYQRDSVVQVDGKTYVCLVPNTSAADFYTDLNQSPFPYWNLVVDGKTWTGPWVTGYSYGLGNVVTFGGKAYYCVLNHTSTTFAADSAKWAEYVESDNWTVAWQPNYVYGVNDVVRYGGIVYKCIANHTSAANATLGLEANQSSWTTLFSGVVYRGAWTGSSYRYKTNDLVKLDADIYICTTGHTSSATFASANWATWLPGFIYEGVWASNVTYQPGDTVQYGGYAYVSNTQNNLGNVPSTDSTDWTLFTQGYEFKQDWSGSTAYKVGDVVRYHGHLFEAIADNNGQNPTSFGVTANYTASGSTTTAWKVSSTTGIQAGMIITGSGIASEVYVTSVNAGSSTVTVSKKSDLTLNDGQVLSFSGINYLYWTILSPGKFWTKTWTVNTQYSVGDIAVWKNGTYVCVGNHTASSLNRPDLDTVNTYWAFYVPHSRKNALNTYGDLEYFDSTTNSYVALPISNQSYVLRNTGGVPTWSVINQVANVFYVSNLTGQDNASYGKSWDRPWKSIGYACNYITQGYFYTAEVAALKANRNWLVAEMLGWTNSQITNSTSGFTPSYVLDSFKAGRDAGYIIDAIAYDLGRGSNSQTVAATLSFFAFNDPSNFYNSAVKADVPYYLPMLGYLGNLISSVVTNSDPGQSFQTTYSRIPATGTLTPGAQSAAASLLGLITSALNTSSTSQLPSPNTGVSSTIFVKSGTYPETLPIAVPANTAIVGDELRSVVVEPATTITQYVTATSAASDLITVASTAGLNDQTVVQFVDPVIPTGFTYTGFGNITPGQNYYVVGSTITPTSFSITSSTGTYTVSASNVSSSGSGATFYVTPNTFGQYTVTLNAPGTGYVGSDTIKILGTNLGGLSPDNDIAITINSATLPGAITTFQVSSGSSLVQLADATGQMTMYAGDCLKDMFRLRNATGLRNLTLTGLVGSLGPVDSNLIQRPTGGSYACLDPGTGPSDTSAWIYRRSPYVQNVTAFGNGCTALKIDGTLHNGGNKSIVANDFTHLVSDGIGVWCTGPSALTECISVFSYYGYSGYFAENGGRIRAANGNSSYGQYGVIASGYDPTETPATGIIYNRSSQVQAQVQQAYGTNSQLLRLTYTNSGSNYLSTTTNLINQSNNFLGNSWVSDGNLTFAKNTLAPSGINEAWTLLGTTGGPDGSYVYQNINIPSSGATYTGLTATNITGSGGTGLNTPATFNVTVTSTAYVVTVNNPGSGYAVTNQMYIAGSQLGGVDVTNNCVITVTGLSGSGVQQVSVTGTVPSGSAFKYTFSIYVKQGTAPSIDLQAIYSGSSTVTSALSYNFSTGAVTVSNANGGFLPTSYGATSVQLSTTSASAGWYRLYFTFNDTTGLNTQLQLRLYPRGYNGVAGGYTYFYGSQLEVSNSYSPSFYLEVVNASKYTAYANYNITGAGTGVITVGDEIRSQAVFESRVVTDSTGVTGGSGYLTASNNAQSGSNQYVQLAQSDTNTNGNYTGMRVFINSGTGAGQYGYISYYDTTSKNAYVLKESFDPINITATSAVGNLFSLNSVYNTSTMYVNQPVQFIPTYYNTAVSSTSLSQTTCTASIGGTTDTLTVASTLGMYVNMPLTFTSQTSNFFTNVTAGYTYYIYAIIDSTTIQITNQLYGNVWNLNTGTGTLTINFPSNNSYLQGNTNNMVVNYPIQFTGTALGGLTVGTVYYVNDVIDGTNFSISNALVNVSVTATNSSNNGLTVTSTGSLIPLNPIVFSAPVFGNIVDGTKYYISQILDSQTFTVASTLINVNVSSTAAVSNLITVSSTANFQANQPIRFVGNSFGGIVAETTYYILVINDSQTFTISQTPGGGALTLTTATGSMNAITCPSAFVLTSATGTMAGVSTATKTKLSLGLGSMNATFSTSLFGGVTLGTTYYITAINGNTTFTVSTSQGGGALTLATKTGSMNLAAVGWDHINVGTPILSVLDSSSVYYIEPRTVYTDPIFYQQAASSTVNLAVATSWVSMAYGNGYWLALPSGNSTAASSTDGSTWTSVTLPSAQSWTGVAYGNGFWIIIASGGTLAAVSKSNGQGWRTKTLPTTTDWTNIVYGNGTFVALSSTSTTAAYSTDYGNTWTISYLPSNHTFAGTGNAKISTTSARIGSSSLNLDGTANTYLTSASSADYGYGTGDFTIEGWFFTSVTGAAQSLIDQRTSAADVAVLLELSATLAPRIYINGSYVITHQTSATTNTWYHVAVVRASGTTTLYLNGVASTTTYSDSNNYAAKPIVVGAYYTGATRFTGYLDEIRVSKTARYTTAFTPSTTAFAVDSTTQVLLHFENSNNSTVFANSTISNGGATWSSITYGAGLFIAVGKNSNVAAYSSDGITWTSSTLPRNTNWSSIAYGNNQFIAVSTTSGTSAYTFDGITWNSSNISVAADEIAYGQGVFVAVSASSSVAYTIEGGLGWKTRNITNDGYGALAFGYSSTGIGTFATLAGRSTGSTIFAGAKTKGRAVVTSGTITSISTWEPGSNYTSLPTVSFVDPNVTTLAVITPRTGNGVLSSPTFINRGTGYNTSSTVVAVSGNGYSDAYQTGLTIIMNNLTRLPQPGDNVTISGVSQIYKVTSAYGVYSTVAPNLEANVSLSPSVSVANATANGTAVTIRSKYSQARLTNHDFLNIGYGDFTNSNYPGYPAAGYASQPNNQVVEVNYGRVFYSSTDQDGNFKVGNLFGVQQATGIVTLSASQFGLTGLNSLSLGGIAVGGSSVTITQFSTDSTFTANSDAIIPTQKAIKTYLTSRLSQGGANTFTGQLTAGTVVVGGPNFIRSTVANGVQGSVVKMTSKVNFAVPPGATGNPGVDGNMAALDFFMRHSSHK